MNNMKAVIIYLACVIVPLPGVVLLMNYIAWLDRRTYYFSGKALTFYPVFIGAFVEVVVFFFISIHLTRGYRNKMLLKKAISEVNNVNNQQSAEKAVK